MKTMAKRIGIIALAALIGLSMTACPTDGSGGGVPNPSASLGLTLTLSGQVHTMNDGTTSITFTPFTGNLSINSGGIGGNGAVTGGQLSFTIDTPSSLGPLGNLMEGMNDTFTNVQISPAGAQAAALGFQITDSYDYDYLARMNMSVAMSTSSYTGTSESVTYIYVDRDVTITATGGTFPEPNGYGSVTVSDMDMSLKQGWNTMHQKMVSIMSQSGETMTMSVSAANPSHLRWVLFEN